MKGFIGVILLFTCITSVISQYDGPVPPRLQIPGAIPIRPAGGPNRNERLVAGNNVVRIRRPFVRPQPINALPIQQRNVVPIEEAKPVTEEHEEEIAIEPFVPQIISSPPAQPAPPQALFTNEPNGFESHEELPQQQQQQHHTIPRFQPQERPSPQRINQDRYDIPQQGAQRFNPNPKPVPQQRPRPQAQQQYREPQQQRVQYQERDEPVRQVPIRSRPHSQEERERKPVAQILRKYREENEDGSITWGFENDDGSFKEEIIGIDCVTRGRYGYVDPDGLKREYNYETGILCDPNRRDLDQDEEDQFRGSYVDYQENKAVLPNGQKIDLTKMGKNKSKRPSQQQQQQQQQYYRN